MVATGNSIQDSDFNDAAGRVAAVFGNGSGQTGYGERVPSAELLVGTNNIIDADHYNALISDINNASQHQSGSNAIGFTYSGVSNVGAADADIIGADGSGTSLTRTTTGFTIDNEQTNEGFNDILTAVTSIETGANNYAGETFTASDPQAKDFVVSERVGQWNTFIDCELDVIFDAQYTTTNSDGTTTTLDGTTNDHRRHFFNAGGEIYLSIEFTSPQTSKDVIWKELFDNMDYITFGKSQTTKAGSGDVANGSDISPAVGNYQLTTAYKQIYIKYADPNSAYSANYIEISAKRVGQNTIRFRIYCADDATGNPLDDEFVLQFGGKIKAGIALKRPNGYVTVPEPTPNEEDSFQT